MSTTLEMLGTYPADLGGIDKARLAACIDACVTCAQVCSACADACLSEDMVEQLRKCIRTCLDCADICAATGRVCPATPAMTPTSPVRCSRPAPPPARLVATSACSMRRCTSTAGSVPNRAAGVSRPAATSSARWPDRLSEKPDAGGTGATSVPGRQPGLRYARADGHWAW
jgi:Domain of Unknown Function (DUF326)